MRKEALRNGEIYHVYNRGVDKRDIFSESYDVARFLESMREFNDITPTGSLYQRSFRKKQNQLSGSTAKPRLLVQIIAYCLNPNHFHFILKQVSDGGISEYMKRLSGGYTWYFNHKYERNGTLFQGRFKSVHVSSDIQLLHLSAYVNLNNEVHRLKKTDPLFARYPRSSWAEYIQLRKTKKDWCMKEPVLDQFKNCREYEKFAYNSLRGIVERKKLRHEMEALLLE